MPAEDPELLGTAFGLLTNELAQSPEASIEAVLRLLEQVGRRMQSTFKASECQALRLDTQDPHASTTKIILSVLRLCCRAGRPNEEHLQTHPCVYRMYVEYK